MILKNMWWMFPLWDGAADGGSGAAAAADKGVGASDGDKGGGGSGDASRGGDGGAVSLRSQLSGLLDEGEREGFNKWAESYPTDKDFVKSTLIQRSQFDQRVPVPGDKSKPEDWHKYFERVGKPAGATDYKYNAPKGEDGKPVELGDGDKARLEAFKAHAHANHFTQKQFDAGLEFLEKDIAQQNAAFDAQIDAAYDKSVESLKSEWGPDYEANLAAAVDGGVAFAPDEESWRTFVNLPLANGMRVGDHPTLLMTMAKVGRSSGEDQRVRNMHQSGEADNIQTEINRLENEAMEKGMSTAAEPYHSQLNKLYKKLHPQTTVLNNMIGGQGFGAR